MAVVRSEDLERQLTMGKNKLFVDHGDASICLDELFPLRESMEEMQRHLTPA